MSCLIDSNFLAGWHWNLAFKKPHLTLWNNSLISISILRDNWLETMRDGHKRFLIYLDFRVVCFYCLFYGAKVSICIELEEFIR